MKIYIFVTEENGDIRSLFINPFCCYEGLDPYEFINKIDNGSLISTGLWIPANKMGEFKELCKEWGVKLYKCNYDEANHSGCLSSCVLRGDAKCTW